MTKHEIKTINAIIDVAKEIDSINGGPKMLDGTPLDMPARLKVKHGWVRTTGIRGSRDWAMLNNFHSWMF